MHQPLVYAGVINMVGKSIDNIKTNTEAHVNASEEVGLEVNREKTKFILMSHN
jgi:hypothetical protein